MHVRKLAVGIALSLCFSVGPAMTAAEAAPLKAGTTIQSRTEYSANSSESASVFAWLEARSPEHAPLTPPGKITVTVKRIGQGMATRSGSDGPPVPLPSSGNQGEEITVTNRQPDGTIETWAYTWIDSGWVLVEYHYKSGYNPEDIK